MSDEHDAPVWRNTILWIGFLVVVVLAVFTVLVPELQSDNDEDTTEQAEETEAQEE